MVCVPVLLVGGRGCANKKRQLQGFGRTYMYEMARRSGDLCNPAARVTPPSGPIMCHAMRIVEDEFKM